MDNRHLVDLVRQEKNYLGAGERSKGILQVMELVDRQKFIPSDLVMPTISVSPDKFMYLEKRLVALDKCNGGDCNLFKYLHEVVHGAENMLLSTKEYNILVKDLAYNDEALPIGHGQTCSQPSMVAFMTDALELQKGMKISEIGSGCGYHAAIVSHVIGSKCNGSFLVTMEYVPELAELASKNLENHFGKGELKNRLKVIQGDGSAGLTEGAPFDRIYATAGVDLEKFKPDLLAEQLNPQGILLFPEIAGALIKRTYNKGKQVDEKRYEKVAFVPLVGQNS